jgi:hypothetical protein
VKNPVSKFAFKFNLCRYSSGAAYYVNDSDDIAELLATLTNSLDDGKGRVELLQFDTESSLVGAVQVAFSLPIA